MKNKSVLKLTITAILIALCYVSFALLKITIPTPLGYTSFHLGNVMCVVAALLLGGVTGGIVGAIGMGIGDILDPVYIMIAPKTIILKMVMGLVVGTVAHKAFKINTLEDKKLTKAVIISSACGMIGNMIGEPVFGYFYYKFVLNAPDKALHALVGYNLVSTSVNAVLTVVLATIIYLVVRKRFKNIINSLND